MIRNNDTPGHYEVTIRGPKGKQLCRFQCPTTFDVTDEVCKIRTLRAKRKIFPGVAEVHHIVSKSVREPVNFKGKAFTLYQLERMGLLEKSPER